MAYKFWTSPAYKAPIWLKAITMGTLAFIMFGAGRYVGKSIAKKEEHEELGYYERRKL